MGGRRLEQPLTSETYLQKIIARSREMSPSLGDLCKFDVKGVEIAPEELLNLLTEFGLQDWQPVQIRKRTAARKAITRIKHTLEDPANHLKVIVRRVPTMEVNVIRYAIIDETVAGLDLDYSTRNQVVFREDTGTIEFTQETNQAILEEFQYMCSVYTDSEIIHMVRNLISNHGCIWFRDNSGMFFMPKSMKDMVDSLVNLFNKLAERTEQACYFRPIAILDDAENRATMGEALIVDLSMELQDAMEHLDKAGGDEGSKLSLIAALKKFKIAKGKASIYKDMLQLNLEDINQKIDAANTKASDLMVKMTNESAEGAV